MFRRVFAGMAFLYLGVFPSAATSPAIFTDHGTVASNPEPGVLRRANAVLDTQLLLDAPMGTELEFNLLPGQSYTCVLNDSDAVHPLGGTISGHDILDSHNVLFVGVHGGSIRIDLQIPALEVVFTVIAGLEDGQAVVSELSVAEDHCDLALCNGWEEDELGEKLDLEADCNPANRTVDLMVVYTPHTAVLNGGRTAVVAKAKGAVTALNKALLRSEVEARIRLVHVAALDFDDTEVLKNGRFQGNANHWVLGTGFVYDNNSVVVTGASDIMHQPLSSMEKPWLDGEQYNVTISISDYSAGTLYVGTSTDPTFRAIGSSGNKVFNMLADGDTSGIVLTAQGFTGTIESISLIRELWTKDANVLLHSSTKVISSLNGDSAGLAVQVLRNWVGADLVSYWKGTNGGDAPTFLFNSTLTHNSNTRFVSRVHGSFTDVYHFAHEIGHNFGGRHNCSRYLSEHGCPLATSPFPVRDAFGWNFQIPLGAGTSQRRTIMAYTPGSRVGYFSNPEVAFEGTTVPTGIYAQGTENCCLGSDCDSGTAVCDVAGAPHHVGANVARVINSTVGCVSSYRPSVNALRILRSDSQPLVEILSNGNCVVYGEVLEEQGDTALAADAGAGDFVVRDKDGVVLARVGDATGQFLLRGEVLINQTQVALDAYADNAGQELLVRNADGQVVAVLDDAGNLRLLGEYVEYHWEFD